MDKIYIIDYDKGDYYELKAEPSTTTGTTTTPSYFSEKKLDEVKLQDVAKIESDDVEYSNGKVNIELKTENVELLKSNFKDTYTFSNNKHEMCTIYLNDKQELDDKTLVGGNSKPQIIESNNELFGSYKKYFAGDGRENLGISETDYETAFKSIYAEDKYTSKDADKKIVQVKLRSSTDKKYYYDYMAIKQKGNKFSLEKLKGLDEAKAEMKRRLDNLVLLDKIQASPQ